MKERVLYELHKIEQEKNIRVLYACESGSRAWGFPSTDSDYDIRFIYINKPEWYLSILEKRDVVERMIPFPIPLSAELPEDKEHSPKYTELDFSGWDLKKALRLFRKSNPAIMEWIHSPIVYWNPYDFSGTLRSIVTEYFSYTASSYHYLHMAHGNFKDYLKADTVWTKKYFYVLRPLLAVKWMEQGRGIPPVDFVDLVNKIDISDVLREAIHGLIGQKKAGKELGRGSKNHVISAFIEMEMDKYLKMKFQHPKPSAPVDILDNIFLNFLDGIYGYIS